MQENDGGVVLLIGLTEDRHIEAVKGGLDDLGIPSFFFDPSEDEGIPTLRQLHPERAVLEWADGRTLVTSSVRSVFCRYAIDKLHVNADLPDLERFALMERLQAALSALRCLHSSLWMNDPWYEARADCKLYQTHLAARLGFKTPEQIVTNSVRDVLDFAQKHQSVVIKSISDCSLGVSGEIVYCDRPIPTRNFYAPYTTDLPIEALSELLVDDTPSLVQEKIRKNIDIRAVVIDSDVIAYAIRQDDRSKVDFRLNEITEVIPIEMPERIVEMLVQIVRLMNLRFASCDLIRDVEGQFIFLEANVSGNYLFCELEDNFRITKTLARALSNGMTA